MDSVKPPTANASGLLHAVAKILRLRKCGIAPDDGTRKVKLPHDTTNVDHHPTTSPPTPPPKVCSHDEKLRTREALEVLLAKLFAGVSAIKAAYAQLQIAQSPYDPDCIESADETVVSELKNLSELKHCYFKKQIFLDHLPTQDTQLSAELREQQNLLKTYEITVKKLQSQLQLKDSEILFLEEKLQDSDKQSKRLEKRLNPSTAALDNLHFSGLNPTHFIKFYNHTLKSIRSFVKLTCDLMVNARWDIDVAACSIEPSISFVNPNDRFFVFESYVCRKMFAGFQEPDFCVLEESSSKGCCSRQEYFKRFMDLKSRNPVEFLTREKPRTDVGEFCRLKYLSLVHPKMEAAFFGDDRRRKLVSSGGFPATPFFEAFAEMAKRVWVLHCLGFSFEPEASIFQARKGCRFSEVYMEEYCTAAEGGSAATSPQVGFTVVPGFVVGKTVVQCKVCVSPASVQL